MVIFILSRTIHGEDVSCFNPKKFFGHSDCEISTLKGSEANIKCSGDDAVKTANQVLLLCKKSVIFTELSISSSRSENLQAINLKGFQHVKRLQLSQNNIIEINPSLFSIFHNLESLNLSHNNIKEVRRDSFWSLSNLQDLSLSNNEITHIDTNAFHQMKELLHLDLSGNHLGTFSSSWLPESKKLVSLNLSNNKIFEIRSDNFKNLTSLQELDLMDNMLEELSHSTFFELKELKHLSLAQNNLKTLNGNIFKGNMLLEQVNLTGNQWVCNRQLLWFNDWLKNHEIDKSYCAEPSELRNSTLQNGLYVLFLEVKLEESPICDASMCNCTVSKDKQVVTVDCTSKGLTALPENLPYKTRVLDLRSNHIKSLTTDHLNATQWADVSFLHLNDNLIDSLKGLEGTWLLRNLVALHLMKNRLTEIPIHILEQFRGGLLDELYLSDNPWNCDCNTVRFQTWLQDNYKTIKDFDGIRCSAESGAYANQPIFRLLKSQLCPQDVQLINYLDVLNGLMAIAIVLIIVKLSYDFWLQKQTGKLPRFFSLNI